MPDTRAQLKRQILGHLRNNGKKAFRPKELSKRLSIKDNQKYKLFRSVLGELDEAGLVERVKGGRYQHRSKEELHGAEGVLQMHPQGYGFVAVPGRNDVYVPATRMKTALDGDLVRVSLAAPVRGKRSDRHREAEILEVLERGRKRTVGTFDKMGHFAFVKPDDQRLSKDIYVAKENFNGATEGDKVVVSIDKYDDPKASPEGTVLEVLANQITQQVLATTNGVPPIPLPQQEQAPTQLAQLQGRVAKLGHALRMRYIQKESAQPLPAVFDAWMVDRDFLNPERSAVDVRVLLTRDQLSDLKNVMQQVLELAEEGVLSPKNFIDDLKSLAATVSRDPSSVAGSTSGAGANLADMGYMREYIEDLPYTGEVMNLTLESWEDWSAKVQIEFMHRLESKINYYQALHDHTDLWVTPGGGPVNGNSVFPVALELLP